MAEEMTKSRENTNDRQDGISRDEFLKKSLQIAFILEKAVKGGWTLAHRGTTLWNIPELSHFLVSMNETPMVLFNHDFAKALWGEMPIDMSDSATGMSINLNTEPAWKTHLQRMVISPDPIKYAWEHSR